MSTVAAHQVCRVVIACLVLAGLAGRAPGKDCCGAEGGTNPGDLVASASVQQARGGGCDHCSKDDAPAPVAAAPDHSCTTAAGRECGGEPDENNPCDGGACAAVCCHVNAVTTVPPAVAAVAEVAVEVPLADQALPARADGDAIFHPPRA